MYFLYPIPKYRFHISIYLEFVSLTIGLLEYM